MIKFDFDGTASTVHVPGERLDYGVDWAACLKQGETIESSDWSVDEIGMTISEPGYATSSITVVFVAGGTDGLDYVLTNRVTTNQGRTYKRQITLKCRG